MNQKTIFIKTLITAIACTVLLVILAKAGNGEPNDTPPASHVVTKTCNGNTCSAVVNLYDKQYIMQYTLDSDGDMSDYDILPPKGDVSRETVLALKDAVIVGE